MHYLASRSGVPEISDYSAALQHFNSVTPWRGREERPAGERRFRNRSMRMDGDDIIFAYKQFDFLTFHKNGQISIRVYPGQINAYDYVGWLLPQGIFTDNGTHTGPMIWMSTTSSNKWLCHWADDALIVKARDWVRLRCWKGNWKPVDEKSLEPFVWHELPRKGLAKHRDATGLTDLNAWLDMVSALDDQGTIAADRKELPVEEVLELIKQGKLFEALCGCPRGVSWRYQHLGSGSGGNYVQIIQPIKRSFLTKLRSCAYHQGGATIRKEKRILTRKEWKHVEYALRRYAA